MKIFAKKQMMQEKTTPKQERKWEALIGEKEIARAFQILSDYKSGKLSLERRIVENEKWWKMQHWDLIRNSKGNDPEPASAWLFNSIANKHADAMDSYPEPAVLPREQGDSDEAKMLSSILPVMLERNDFEKTYSDAWWYKLKTGTACYGVFWNNQREGGMGDIDIMQVDILNVFWEPGIKDIQKSRNLFTVELVDNDVLSELYPDTKGKTGGASIDVAKYLYDDTVDTSDKSVVVDWYYKKNVNGKQVVHYCKFVNNVVLYASQNDPVYRERGYYDHGMYPLVFDPLFVEEGTPCGFGYIDIMKDVQMYIDKLNQIIIKNTMQAGRRRFFISDNTGINEEEFADWSREFVHVAGNVDDRNLREITVSQLDSGVINLLYQKIEEIKEISGNRDVSSGGTTKGVTAASAIAALQEAGGKLSRDMIKNSYRAFRQINYLMIELVRQFYDDNRSFRITGEDGTLQFVRYSNESLSQNFLKGKRPVFDIVVKSQKSSPFSKTAQNELAKELFAAGIFNPANSQQALLCIEMMDFEGKAAIADKIRANSKMNEEIEKMNIQMQKMAEIINHAYGNSEGNNTDNLMKKARQSIFQGKDRLSAAQKAFRQF